MRADTATPMMSMLARYLRLPQLLRQRSKVQSIPECDWLKPCPFLSPMVPGRKLLPSFPKEGSLKIMPDVSKRLATIPHTTELTQLHLGQRINGLCLRLSTTFYLGEQLPRGTHRLMSVSLETT